MTPEPDRQQPDYPYPLIALWAVGVAAIIAGLATAGTAIDEQTSLGDPNPWPALLYQPLLTLGSLALVAALLGTALRR